MVSQDIEVEPEFSYPVGQLVNMGVVVTLVAVGTYLVFPRVAPVFFANPWLNGVIAAVFFFGLFACFGQLYQLLTSVRWIEGFAAGRVGHELVKPPSLLATMAALLRSRGARSQISATSSRSILDSVATRIDEVRDITRYVVNLLIFLGLLGTFFGLATTVPAVVQTIQSLEMQAGESSTDIFSRLMGGLETQLGGMGTAFASSLLGLAGSLVVGLLELFASHGQNRFYRELEDWLSTITRVGFASGETDGSGQDQNAVAAVMDHMVAQMDGLQEVVLKSETSRSAVEYQVASLAASVDKLAERLGEGHTGEGTDNAVLAEIANGQERMIAALEGASAGGDHVDAESRMRLRSIDVQLLRILEEMSAGRQETLSDLRQDLRALTTAIKGLRG